MKTIPVSGGHTAFVDDEDYDALKGFKWHAKTTGAGAVYPRTGENYMHRMILKPPAGLEVDHIDRNPLNNTRVNIRFCTHAENCRNRRGGKGGEYHGVSRHKRGNKWQVHLQEKDMRLYLGIFSDKVEAAKAYDTAARKHHGEFALLNFPEVS